MIINGECEMRSTIYAKCRMLNVQYKMLNADFKMRITELYEITREHVHFSHVSLIRILNFAFRI